MDMVMMNREKREESSGGGGFLFYLNENSSFVGMYFLVVLRINYILNYLLT